MVAARYTIEEFVHDIKPIMESEKDVNKLLDRGSSLLEKLVQNPDCVPEKFRVPNAFAKGRPNHGTYKLYGDADGLSIVAVVWGPGDHADPHDHHVWGMIGLLENTLQETRFRRLDDRSREDYAQLERDRVGRFKPGEITLLVPQVDEIHQMDNFTDRPTVEVHVYGHPLAGLKRCRFDVETGKISPFVTGTADNE